MAVRPSITRAVVYPNEIDRIMKMPGGPVGVRVRRLALDIVEEGQKIADAELGKHPYDHKRTGNYRRRFRVEVQRNAARGFEFVVMNNAKYAAVLEKGSSPHEIRARKAQYLRFRSRRTGMWVTVKAVRHPGQKRPYKILERAMMRAVAVSRLDARKAGPRP